MKNIMRNLLNKWNRLGTSLQTVGMPEEDRTNPARRTNIGEGGAAEYISVITASPGVKKSAKSTSWQKIPSKVIALSSLQRLLNEKLVEMNKRAKKQEGGKEQSSLYVNDAMRHGALLELMKFFVKRDKKTNLAKGIKFSRKEESSSHFVDANPNNKIKGKSEDDTGKENSPFETSYAAPSETLKIPYEHEMPGLKKIWEAALLNRRSKGEDDIRSVSLNNDEVAPIDLSGQQNNARVEHDEGLSPVEKNSSSAPNMPFNVGDDPAADTTADKTIAEWKKMHLIRIIENLLDGRDITKNDLLYLQREPEMLDFIGRILAQSAA